MKGKVKYVEDKGTYTNASGTFNKYQVTLMMVEFISF